MFAAQSDPNFKDNIELAGRPVQLSTSESQVDTPQNRLLRVRSDILFIANRVYTVERSQSRRKTRICYVFVILAIIFIILIASLGLTLYLYITYHYATTNR